MKQKSEIQILLETYKDRVDEIARNTRDIEILNKRAELTGFSYKNECSSNTSNYDGMPHAIGISDKTCNKVIEIIDGDEKKKAQEDKRKIEKDIKNKELENIIMKSDNARVDDIINPLKDTEPHYYWLLHKHYREGKILAQVAREMEDYYSCYNALYKAWELIIDRIERNKKETSF